MLVRAARCAAVFAFCILPSTGVLAENAGCTSTAQAALGEIACELAGALGPAAKSALVVTGPLATDLEPKDAERLVSRLATLVTGALGPAARVADRPATLAEARRQAQHSGTLLYLSVRLGRDRLEVSADLYPVARRFWQRVKNPAPGASAHAFASRALDAEIRSFLPPVPLVARKVDKAQGMDPDVVALACGDADGDGSNELVVVGRRRISVGRIRAQQFRVEKSVGWSDLVPVAPAPLREPVSSAWVVRPGVIEVGSSDRAEAVRLDASLAKTAALGRILPWPGGGCARIDGSFVADGGQPCGGGEQPRVAAFESPLDALAGATLTQPDGARRWVRVGRSAKDQSLSLQDSAGAKLLLERAGAQVAVGDLDGDGTTELVASLDTLEPKDDAVVVYTASGGRLEEKWRVPVASGVRALAICPFEGSGIAPIGIGTGDGLWIVR